MGQSFDGEISMINHRLIGVYLPEFDIHGQIEVKSLNKPFIFKQESLELTAEDECYRLKMPVKITVSNIDVKQRLIRFNFADNA